VSKDSPVPVVPKNTKTLKHDTEITLPDGVHLKIDWNNSALTIKLNGRVIDVSSKSTRVVVGRNPEATDS